MEAKIESGRQMMSGASGRWAGERLLAAIREGRPISPAELRTLDTLRKDEWIYLDEALVEEGQIRLRGVANLMGAGLVVNVPNAMGKTVLQWEKVTDMNPAEVTLSGIPRTENDRQEFELESLPLPIVHKDFDINLRTLEASRTRGEGLDTTQAGTAGRLVSERQERMLYQGGPIFAGLPIYGLTTHPDRNNVILGAPGAWNLAAKTGQQILTDVLNCITALENDRFYGPYWLDVCSAWGLKLSEDFKAQSDKTIMQRLLDIDSLKKITICDQMPNGHATLYQATQDVVAVVNGETLQSVQWDIEGGFIVKFKAFAIWSPLVRSDAQNRSGVADLHA